jgi:hypothetical protein
MFRRLRIAAPKKSCCQVVLTHNLTYSVCGSGVPTAIKAKFLGRGLSRSYIREQEGVW